MERFEISEGIFKPEVWGLDQAGVHVLVKKAIAECSLDVRREVTQSIFLSGGLTMLPGFKERLEAELEKLLPAKPRVHASPHRCHLGLTLMKRLTRDGKTFPQATRSLHGRAGSRPLPRLSGFAHPEAGLGLGSRQKYCKSLVPLEMQLVSDNKF